MQSGYMCGRNIAPQNLLPWRYASAHHKYRQDGAQRPPDRRGSARFLRSSRREPRRSPAPQPRACRRWAPAHEVAEQNARAAQEFFAGGVRLLHLQQRDAEFVQGWSGEAVEAVREQTEHNVRTAKAFARGISKQQEAFGALSWAWAGTYREFFSPFAYFRQGVRRTQQAAQQAARQGLEATEQVARQGLRVAQEATE